VDFSDEENVKGRRKMRKLLILSFVLVFAVAANADYRWQFNDGSGTIASQTGSPTGSDGTLANDSTMTIIPTWTTDSAEGDYALEFASWGINDYVDFGQISVPGEAFTVALHAKPNSYSDYPYFVSTVTSWSKNNDGFRVVYQPTGKIEFSGSGYRCFSDPCAITDGVWQEIICDYDYDNGTGGVVITVDGVDVTATTGETPAIYVNGTKGHIGWRSDTKGDYYGLMDDVRITPEPMTIALLGLGAFGVLRRRRR
jgi:hypothetical protein